MENQCQRVEPKMPPKESSSAEVRPEAAGKPRADVATVDKLLLVVTSTYYGVVLFLRACIGPITDVLANKFHTNSTGISLLSSMYFLPYFLFQMPTAVSLEFVACEALLIGSMLLLSAALLLFASAQSLFVAALSRFLMGMCSAPVWISVISFVSARFGKNAIPKVCGFTMLWGQIAVTCGLTLEAVVWDSLEMWRPVYYSLAVYCLLCFLLVASLFVYSQLSAMTETEPKEKEKESVKKLVEENTEEITADFAPETKSPISTRSFSWERMRSVSLRKAEGIESMSFSDSAKEKQSLSRWQRVARDLKKVASNSQNWLLGLLLFFVVSVRYATVGLWFVPYVMLKYNLSRAKAAFIASLSFLSGGFGSALMAPITKRTGLRKPVIYLCVFNAATVEMVLLCPRLPTAVLSAVVCVFGSSIGFVPTLSAVAREMNWFHNCSEVAVAFVNTVGVFAGFTSQMAMGTLMDFSYKRRPKDKRKKTADGDPKYQVADFDFAFVIVHCSLFCALLCAFFIRETHCQNVLYPEDDVEMKDKDPSQSECVDSPTLEPATIGSTKVSVACESEARNLLTPT